MKTNHPSITLNAITGPRVTAPAVAPEILKGLFHPYFNFLHTYCIEKSGKRWHGRIKNVGLQIPIHDTIVLPPDVMEMLGLYNDDIVKLSPSNYSEATHVHYEKLNADSADPAGMPPLTAGTEFNSSQTRFSLSGKPIRIHGWDPEKSYFGENTVMIDIKSASSDAPSTHDYAADIISDKDDTKQLKTKNKTIEE
jgi:hypothetical protein